MQAPPISNGDQIPPNPAPTTIFPIVSTPLPIIPIEVPTKIDHIETETDSIYQAKKLEIQNEIASIQSGSHIEFSEKCKILREENLSRVNAFEEYKRLQIQSIETQIEMEKKQLDIDFNYEVSFMRDKMIAELHEKERILDQVRLGTKKKVNGPPRPLMDVRKKRGVTNVTFCLSNDQIFEDLKKINPKI